MIKIRYFLTLAVCSAVLFGLSADASADVVIADAAADYVDENTVPAGWEYLRSTLATGGAEVALTPNTVLGAGSGVGNLGFGGIGGFNLPAVLGSVTAAGAEFEIFADGTGAGASTNRPGGHSAIVGTDLVLHPSTDAGAEFLILRYTVQNGDLTVSNDLNIAGSFRDLSGRIDRGGPTESVIASVLVNGSQQFSATGGGAALGTPSVLDQATGTFDFDALGVSVGSTVDFVLNANGNQAGDETAFQATITNIAAVPEPSSLALLALGGLGMVSRRRR